MKNSKTINVALVQQCCTEDKKQNLENSTASIRSSVNNGSDLILLQELHTNLYFCQRENVTNFDLAETIPGPTTDTLARLSKELGIVIVCSVFEKSVGSLYHNTAVVIENDGSIAGKYRKMHIPDGPGYHERFYFAPGDLGFTPINTSVGKLGVMVCWDQWFPEAARLMALAGAELLLYPTAIGWDPVDDEDEKQRQLDSWITIQRSHAIANSIPVLSCNRTGFEADTGNKDSGIQFWGNSFIAGPQGEILSQASPGSEEILYAEINLARSEEVRKIWPFLRDRHIDAYQDLLRRFQD